MYSCFVNIAIFLLFPCDRNLDKCQLKIRWHGICQQLLSENYYESYRDQNIISAVTSESDSYSNVTMDSSLSYMSFLSLFFPLAPCFFLLFWNHFPKINTMSLHWAMGDCILSIISIWCSVQVKQLQNPEMVFERIIGLVIRLAEHGLIHCDFNEFNIMVCN